MIRTPALRSIFALLLLTAVTAGAAGAQDLKSFEEKTTVHKLANGWTFIIVERPTAPVFSFATVADVGSAQEVPGITGIAHMFEHMAFKGTPNLGTTDYAAEKKALEALEASYQAWQAERLAPRPDAKKLEALQADFRAKQEEAARYVAHNEFDDVLTREGGVGMNATTGADETSYFYSLPANKVELFAFLESERFAHPVFREFYEERDVVREERRMSYESRPIGRLIEQFITTSYQYHPYQQPGIGTPSDLQAISITDAQKFFDTYYVPSNLTTAVVGDVKAAALIPILEKYFGRIPARPAPPPLRTVEPKQIAERTVVLEDAAQPFYLEGYHKPASTHPDQPVYDAIDDILSNGRTSRLYRSLVRDKKLAVDVQSFSGFPGEKYPNLWAALAVPAFGVTNQQVQAALREEIDRLKREDVADEELTKFKTRSKANLIRGLRSNQGLARQLAEYQRLYGDWRELFGYIDRLDKVTKADIRRVANETFQAPNRTVAMIVNREAQKTPAPAAPGAKK
jgi:predicted Zn-dependent peptidase